LCLLARLTEGALLLRLASASPLPLRHDVSIAFSRAGAATP